MAAIDGYEVINPGESYAHSPTGADSRGCMKNWTDKGSHPAQSDSQGKSDSGKSSKSSY